MDRWSHVLAISNRSKLSCSAQLNVTWRWPLITVDSPPRNPDGFPCSLRFGVKKWLEHLWSHNLEAPLPAASLSACAECQKSKRSVDTLWTSYTVSMWLALHDRTFPPAIICDPTSGHWLPKHFQRPAMLSSVQYWAPEVGLVKDIFHFPKKNSPSHYYGPWDLGIIHRVRLRCLYMSNLGNQAAGLQSWSHTMARH